MPLQPLVAGQALLAKHGDSPFWRSVKAEAIPLLEGCRFPAAPGSPWQGWLAVKK